MEFKEINLADHGKYSEYYKKCMMLCADMSFMAVWGRSLAYKTVQAFERDFYWHKVNFFGEECWLPPIGDWDSVDWEDVLTELVPPGTTFCLVPEYLLKKWQAFSDRIAVEESRGDWDYVCNLNKFVELKGNTYKSIRQAINKFEKSYEYTFTEINHDDIAEIRDFQARWMQGNEGHEKMTDYLIAMNQIIQQFFGCWGKFPNTANILGRVLRVEGRIIAYIIAESLDEHVISIVFLEADKEYPQAARFIQYMLLKELAGDYLFYNAWGDVNLEGLRKNKLQENPITLYKKYTVTWKG